MKYILILIIPFLLLASCAHNIPIANLKFNEIKKNNEINNYYSLNFSSDIELIHNLSEKHTMARFDCFFKNGNIEQKDFTNYNGYVLVSVGELKKASNISSAQLYNYTVNVTFDKNKGEFLDEKDIPEIIKLLNKKPKYLNCAITAVTYLQTTK